MKSNIEDLIYSGHTACAGCGAVIAMKLALRALGENTIVALPACCFTVLQGESTTALKVPIVNAPFEATAAVASGIARALKIKNKKANVLAWAGDGGTFDIGLQALSGAAERNEDIIFACYDNEAYMNTGIQKSSATPRGAWTTVTPEGKLMIKKDIMKIMAAHKIPYGATCTIAYHQDFIRKFQKAAQIPGTKFIHILCPCPTGWKMEERLTVAKSRLAVKTGIFPLYEIFDGEKYVLNHPRESDELLPVDTYLKDQGRFAHLLVKETEIKQIQEETMRRWSLLLKACKES